VQPFFILGQITEGLTKYLSQILQGREEHLKLNLTVPNVENKQNEHCEDQGQK
jgi:hypothetical protein